MDDEQRATDARKIKRSPLWKHFSKLGETDKGQCRYCNAEISIKGGSIPNLKKHLNSKHPEVLIFNDGMDTVEESNHESSDEIDVSTILRYNAFKLDNKGNHTSVNNINGFNRSTRRSVVWRHYTVSRKCPSRAKCDYCLSQISFTGGSTNLRKHLRLRHPEVYMDLDKTTLSNGETEEPDEIKTDGKDEKKIEEKDEIADESSSDAPNIETSTLHTKVTKKSNVSCDIKKSTNSNKPSAVWLYFTVSPKFPMRAKCDYCHSYISYTGGANNLRKHLRAKHSKIYKGIENIDTPNEDIGFEEVIIAEEPHEMNTTDSAEKDCQSSPILENEENKRRSIIWNHFTEVLPYRNKATCYHCKRDISKKGGNVGNLRAHMKRRHPKEFREILRDEKTTTNNISTSDCEKTEDEDEDDNDSDVVLSTYLKDDEYTNNVNNMSKRSAIWLHYTLSSEVTDKANCDYCHKYISFKGGTTSNLIKHLKLKHREVFDEIKKIHKPNQTDQQDDSEECMEVSPYNSSSPEKSEAAAEHKTKRRNSSTKSSMVWKHFRLHPNLADKVKCKHCSILMAFKGSSTTSLRNHLLAKHKSVFLVSEKDKKITSNSPDKTDKNEIHGEIKEDASVNMELMDDDVVLESDDVLCNRRMKIDRMPKIPVPTDKTPKDDCNNVFIKFIISELNILKDPLLILETKWKILELIQSARRQELINTQDLSKFPVISHIENNDTYIDAYILSNTEPTAEM